MSVEAFSALPLQAGQAVAATAGRTAMWLVRAYMRAPLRNTALTALMTASAMAGSNALYNQSGQHPAPMFGSFSAERAAPAPVPVMPADRPAQLLVQPPPAAETTASIAPAAEPVPTRPIGNEDVFEVQRKLAAFKLFDAKVDGLYGPRTARAIKAFEELVGRKPTGQLTPEIIEIIKATPITASPVAPPAEVSTPVPPAELAPAAAVTPQVELAPAPAATESVMLAPPAPLVPAAEPAAVLAPASVQVEGGVTSLTMTSPPPPAEAEGPTKRSVQTIAIEAPVAEPAKDSLAVVTTPIDVTKVDTDPKVVSAVQRGLASLGFLHGEIDGVAGEATAKAVRNFEVYYNYNVTGRITPELINLLVQNGAVI